jgi:alpha,alpha-trehalase
MRWITPFFFSLSVAFNSMAQISTPRELYGELFTDVQMSKIFPDSKTFVDCIPKKDPQQILSDYKALKNNSKLKFSLRLFVEENFYLPQQPPTEFVSKEKDMVKHITNLWAVLRRKSDSVVKGSSLLPLPYEYIIPGGRFREIYYWDSYFTMLGLKESKEYSLMENMVQNFAYLINEYGHMPNGNRTYYLSRSQPPYFSLMLDLLAAIKGSEVYVTYLPALEKEYAYWMDQTAKTQHVVKMPDGSLLNRYWDQLALPREEAYVEDVNVTHFYPEHQALVYRHLRSAAESGWDFSSRWFADGKNLQTIQTTNLVPVDLNCLLYHIETTLAKAYAEGGNKLKAAQFNQLAEKRKSAINKYCWSASLGWYVDYNIATKKQSSALTLAGMYPFFLQLAEASKINSAKKILKEKFLKAGGLVTTLVKTGQQWDAPNGWAPLQWISIKGLENYGEKALPRTIAERWYALNKRVFEATGKMVERYDVIDATRPGGGGEYPFQDGFGWTNGVLLALINQYKLK